MRLTFLCATLIIASGHLPRACAVVIETVTVGSPGNLPDPQFYPKNNPHELRFGSVPYMYRIGKTEATNSQYVEFLNAVAATDTHGLFNEVVSPTENRYGIVRSGVNGAYTYSVKANMGNKPVGAVTLWDAFRFTNWLHNGQPSGAQDATTTEDGAYSLNGVTNPGPNHNVARRPGAKWFIPTENEWFKAAFYDPMRPGGGGYFTYTTSSNSTPTPAMANATGDVSNPGPNVANYSWGANWNGVNGHVTTVGSALSASPYGTYDQGGNVTEWTETLVYTPPLQFAVRGGYSQSTFVSDLSTEDRGVLAGTDEFFSQGFRVAAAIPEPTTISIALATVLFSNSYLRRRRIRSYSIRRSCWASTSACGRTSS